MIGERIYEEVVKSRPMGDGTFFSGTVFCDGDGTYRIEFYRYRCAGGMVGRMSSTEVARLVPGLVASMRNGGGMLRDYMAKRYPPGLGSSRDLERQHRTREGAGVCECNGANGADYARLAGFRRLGSGGVRSPGGRPNGEESGFFAVCAPAAREGGEGR